MKGCEYNNYPQVPLCLKNLNLLSILSLHNVQLPAVLYLPQINFHVDLVQRMKKLLIINAVGLAEELISDKTPNLKHYYDQNKQYLKPPCPAVTCTSQATLMTGKTPQEHGIVANGWYFRDLAQVWLWRQTNQLIEGGKILGQDQKATT